MNASFSSTLCLFVSLCLLNLGCNTACAPPTHPAGPSQGTALTLQIATEGVPISLAFYSMAWDGRYLWQYDRAETPRLTRQEPGQSTVRVIPVNTPAIPAHESMAYGQNSLWLLDRNNHIYQLNLKGELQKTLQVEGLSVYGGLEGITWVGPELWLLHKSHLGPEGELVPATFLQVDPDSGVVRKRRPVADTTEGEAFNRFSHQNLTSDAQAFYVARTSIFGRAENQLYRVDRSTGAVTVQALGRIVTGMPTLFRVGETLLGVELLDIDRTCDALCQGHLVVLPDL
ncbi:MAG: hypothetical protein ACO1RX_17230 [Candidatus Sericytochromatia bacterium]